MNSYMSGFSDLIEKYESYQKASGCRSENANGLNFKYFDRYCALHYPGQPLCQEMVNGAGSVRQKPMLPALPEPVVSVLLYTIYGKED